MPYISRITIQTPEDVVVKPTDVDLQESETTTNDTVDTSENKD